MLSRLRYYHRNVYREASDVFEYYSSMGNGYKIAFVNMMLCTIDRVNKKMRLLLNEE